MPFFFLLSKSWPHQTRTGQSTEQAFDESNEMWERRNARHSQSAIPSAKSHLVEPHRRKVEQVTGRDLDVKRCHASALRKGVGIGIVRVDRNPRLGQNKVQHGGGLFEDDRRWLPPTTHPHPVSSSSSSSSSKKKKKHHNHNLVLRCTCPADRPRSSIRHQRRGGRLRSGRTGGEQCAGIPHRHGE